MESLHSSPERKPLTGTIPRIPLNLRAHKTVIGIEFGVLIFVSCILPEIGYFSLRYKTNMKVEDIVSIFTPIFGAASLYSFVMRTYALVRPTSTCRPLGVQPGYGWGKSWALDYFGWNYALGFAVVTAIIAAGIAEVPSNVRVASLPLTVLIMQVAGQMVLLIPLRLMGWRVPFRISSYEKGQRFRPAVYTIAEDVVAVEGKQGTQFRRVWAERWAASPEFRALLEQLDLLWGVSGMLVAVVTLGIIFGVKSTDAAAWAVGWTIPWVWAVTMAVVSIQMTKSMCRRENARVGATGVVAPPATA